MQTILRKLFCRMWFSVFYCLPVQNKIVLATLSGNTLQGNLACLQKWLEKQENLETVIITHRGKKGIRGLCGYLWVYMRVMHALATAAVFVVDDYFFPLYTVEPKPETLVLQTWHGAGAGKKFGYSLLAAPNEDHARPGYGGGNGLLRHIRIHTHYSRILCSGPAAVEPFMEAFGQPREKLDYSMGLPRTDDLFDPGKKEMAGRELREKWGIPAEKHIILYAPTFRGKSREEGEMPPEPDYHRLLSGLGDRYVLLVKPHPFVRDWHRPELPGVLDVSSESITKLMLGSDCLVTDYSSVFFEYALLDRKMFFLCPDLELYEGKRGLYIRFPEELPGPLCYNVEELLEAMQGPDLFREKREVFKNQYFFRQDIHSTERVGSYLLAHVRKLEGEKELRQ